MKSAWWESVKHRLKGAWNVLIGRAWAGYGDPSKWEWIGTDEEWQQGGRNND